jgi:hypothetical protein
MADQRATAHSPTAGGSGASEPWDRHVPEARLMPDEVAQARRTVPPAPDERASTLSGTGGAGVWVDDHGTAARFAGNHVTASAFAGVLVTDGAGGDFDANDLRCSAAGSWKLDEPGALRRNGNLEDTGLPPEAALPDPPSPGPRLVN